MSNYTKTVNFATKDNLSPGNPLKIVKGTEIDTEYNNIATAVATKTDNSAAAITGGTITGITDLAVADGGTGASTAANARSNLSAAASGANSDITSLTGLTTPLTIAQGGTTASTAAGARTSLGLVIGTDVLAPNGSAASLTSFPTFNQNTTGNAATVTTNANLTGAVTSVGNATSLGSFTSAQLLGALTDETGTGSAVFATSPTLVTPILGTPTSGTLTNATGLPISTGVSGLGTGVATFLATPSSANLISAVTDETGTGSLVFATSPTLVTPALGTPTSGVATNLTGLPLTTGVTGLLPVANGGTATATPSIVAGTNITVTGTWPNQTIAASGGSGSVTSVAATVPSIFSISGSPITTSGTLAMSYSGTALPVANGGTGLTAGTSGGVLAYTASGTLASSGVLAQYGVVIGGGAGAVPTSTAVGTATHVLTSNGSGVAPTFQALPASGVTAGKSIAFAMIFGF